MFDTETTGLDPLSGGEIIEIGAVKVVDGKISDRTFQQLIRPARVIPAIATSISGITNEMVSGSPMIRDVLPKFLEWAGRDILVAHNHAFDMSFVRHHCRQLQIAYQGNEVMDTMLLAKQHGVTDKLGLDNLLKKFDIQAPQHRHRGLDDAMATAELFIFLMKQIESKGGDPLETIKPAYQFTV